LESEQGLCDFTRPPFAQLFGKNNLNPLVYKKNIHADTHFDHHFFVVNLRAGLPMAAIHR
jgi:hypothetical protein